MRIVFLASLTYPSNFPSLAGAGHEYSVQTRNTEIFLFHRKKCFDD